MKSGVLIILMICFVSCNNEKELPPGILQAEKMQEVFWDVMMAEAYTTQFIKKDSSSDTQLENAKLQQQIFAIHKISKKEFYDSYSYYNSHVDLMRTLLDSITARREKEKERTLYSKPLTTVRKPISLVPLPIEEPHKLVIIPMPIPAVEQDQHLVPVQKSTPIKYPRPTFNVRPKNKPTPVP
jgi:hypothetical protein